MKFCPKPRFLYILFTFTILIGGISSCAKDPDDISYSDKLIDQSLCVDPFEFVTLGAEWRYGTDVLNGNKITPYDSIITSKIIKLDTTHTYRLLNIPRDTAGIPDTTFSQIIKNDTLYFQFALHEKHPGVFVSIDPLVPLSGLGNSIITLHKKEHKVTVPAGTYTTDVFKVEVESSASYYFMYFSSCVGIARLDEYSFEDELLNRRYLVELKLP